MISHECASCTLPYGLKLDYIMETVPSVQFRSWSLDINVEALALPHGHDLAFGVGSANPWTHVTQRRFRRHTNFRSG